MVSYLKDVIELREQKKTYQEIGEILKVSRAWVGMLIQEHRPDLAGREISEDRPELEQVVEEPDELMGLKTSAKASRVQTIRVVRDGKRVKDEGVNLSRRRRALVKKFWPNKLPGSNFIEFLKDEIIPELETPHQRSIFENFYLAPVDESTQDEMLKDNNKTYRSYLFKFVLPPIIKTFSVRDLTQKGVLKNGRKHPGSSESG